MSTVLLLAKLPQPAAVLAETVRSFHARGVRVALSTMDTDDYAGVGLDEVCHLRAEEDGFEPAFWRTVDSGAHSERMWRYVSRHDRTLDLAGEAVLLVALDGGAVYTVWELAQRHPRPPASFGAIPALRELDRLRAAGDLATDDDMPATAPAAPIAPAREPGPARRLLARWRRDPAPACLGAGLEDDRRIELAVPVIAELNATGHPARAHELAAQVAGLLGTVRARADLWGLVVSRDLVEGRTPPQLRTAYAAELRYADRLHARGQVDPAVGSLRQALRLAFHRTAHFDSLTSPLAADPAGFTEPLRGSAVVSALTAPRGRSTAAVPPPGDRPARVLVLTGGNTTFVVDLVDHLRRGGTEVRCVEPADLPGAERWLRRSRRLLVSELRGDGRARGDAEEALRPHLDWADVVFADWANNVAHFLTLVDPGSTRVVLRLHSFEAWTAWPHLIDYSRIDSVVFVSEHLRELTEAAVPALAAPGGPTRHVVPNAVDLRRFARPKAPDARFTVGLVGYGHLAKDPRWALEVLRGLRRVDERYRLLLVGDDLTVQGRPGLVGYVEQLEADLAELEPRGAVVRTGRTEDVPAALAEVGVILSSSVRESFHVAVVEGAASGAVPVVRDWPYFASLHHGACTLYPREWVVGSVEEAVARILATTSDEATWRRHADEAARTAHASWDLERTGGMLEQLLLR
ncbi:glycosyltransferase family 4 protein [Nocardioides dongkuii]|uniref:glycosyltransferase family 4 protein n=1 Tax=Nocardioides dongkuii TaxID=2760089 RepID=UPI00187885B5|nr:glycosyltransferase family 4 protein [Nocardioides dongkuii]